MKGSDVVDAADDDVPLIGNPGSDFFIEGEELIHYAAGHGERSLERHCQTVLALLRIRLVLAERDLLGIGDIDWGRSIRCIVQDSSVEEIRVPELELLFNSHSAAADELRRIGYLHARVRTELLEQRIEQKL